MILLPYRVDVPMRHLPIANGLIMAATILVSVAVWTETIDANTAESMVQDGYDLQGMLGSLLLHADFWHLLGNMVFLWVFGNAVNGKVGNLWYPLIYIAMGLASGVVQQAVDGSPTIGASGAINGIVGLYLVWFPVNSISCFLWILVFIRTFECDSIVMIFIWLAFDLWGVVTGGGGIAYFAHLGGFAAGFGLAALLTYRRIVESTSYEVNLFEHYDWPLYGDKPATKSAAIARTPPPPTKPIAPPAPQPSKKLTVKCDGCGVAYRAPQTLAGQLIRCPKCNAAITVPFR